MRTIGCDGSSKATYAERGWDMSHLQSVVAPLVLVSALATPVAAQTTRTADAGPFLGTWTLTLDTPQGQTPVTLTVKDTNGTVSGEIGSDAMPPQSVTDVSRAGENLVFKYTRDLGGTALPMKVTLKPADGKMMYEFDMAAGQIVLEGIAVKK